MSSVLSRVVDAIADRRQSEPGSPRSVAVLDSADAEALVRLVHAVTNERACSVLAGSCPCELCSAWRVVTGERAKEDA